MSSLARLRSEGILLKRSGLKRFVGLAARRIIGRQGRIVDNRSQATNLMDVMRASRRQGVSAGKLHALVCSACSTSFRRHKKMYWKLYGYLMV